MKERIFAISFLALTTIGYWCLFSEMQNADKKYTLIYFTALISSYLFYVGLSVIIFYESFKSK